MKICWDNLKELRFNKRSKRWYNPNTYITYEYKESCESCGEPFLYSIGNKPHKFCSISCARSKWSSPSKRKEVIEKARITRKETFEKSPKSVSRMGCMYYDTYVKRLYADEVRRDPDDSRILQVKCIYCGRWFRPSKNQVRHRVNICEGKEPRGWANFYCSEGCKKACPLFGKRSYELIKEDAIRAGRLNWTEMNREVQPQLRQMVLERDDYKCIKCGSDEILHCHHIKPVSMDPIESADIDNCITLCKECHNKVHRKEGCKNEPNICV